MAERAAVRVVCVDEHDRILLLCWRDPANGHLIWEPPGGGIEDGERPIDTARRELAEETGLPGDTIQEQPIDVRRDMEWNGRKYSGTEQFFLARFTRPPDLKRDGLIDYEVEILQGHDWHPWNALPPSTQPPTLVQVLAGLDPSGPWAAKNSQ